MHGGSSPQSRAQGRTDAPRPGGQPWRTQARAPPTHLGAPGARPAHRARRQVPRRAHSRAAGTGSGAGPAGAGRGGGARSPPATPAALHSARGVCAGLAPAGPMFTELRSKLSPPRGRAGAVRAGFGERRDVDGERGWTWARGFRGRGSQGPRGTVGGRDPAGVERRRRRLGVFGGCLGSMGFRGLCPAFRGSQPQALGVRAPLAWGEGVTSWGASVQVGTTLGSPFPARGENPPQPLQWGREGAEVTSRLGAAAPFPSGILTLRREGPDRQTAGRTELPPGVRAGNGRSLLGLGRCSVSGGVRRVPPPAARFCTSPAAAGPAKPGDHGACPLEGAALE